ncbi:MAG: AAA family ATPase [archaeon]
MIINSLKLKNIRSYKKEEIVFPEGSIMLSGDIGAGKTTILLSIEFALFGIMRGQLTGGSLLRHGTSEGYVELTFTIDDKKIVIKRYLKRKNKTVAQDSGHIIIGEEKYELTPVELKSKILELIGYPDELLTKSKSLIFRYTVYTPQEEMKQILLESQDERLEVIRRIFNIDKYKRIKDNTLNYLKHLRIKKTEFETRIEDLEEKKKEYSNYNEKIKTIKEEAAKIQLLIDDITKKFNEQQSKVKVHEEKIKEIESLKGQIEIKTSNISNNKTNVKNSDQELKELNSAILKLDEELKDVTMIDIKKLKKQREELVKEKEKLSDNLEKIRDREAEFTAKKNSSKEIMKKLLSLDKCPVCEQMVDSNHKKHVNERENKNIVNVEEQLLKLQDLKRKRKSALDELEKKIGDLTNNINRNELISIKKEQLDSNIKEKEQIMKDQILTKSVIEKEEQDVIDIKKQLESHRDIEKIYLQEKQTLELIRSQKQSQDIRRAEQLREVKTLEEVKLRVKEEINKKEESKKSLVYVNEVQNWIHKFFMNVIYMMEKQIMLTIYQEFNEYFQEWFNILIEEETLNVRLDETFTPLIEQNGYDTYIANLSGGERTSVALAYRLALNKVINDFMGLIKTKDLLILDEPTDGFSSDQLDKIRDLLEIINIRQVILVSHEPKLESYVDHILRIHKKEHLSKVIA